MCKKRCLGILTTLTDAPCDEGHLEGSPQQLNLQMIKTAKVSSGETRRAAQLSPFHTAES